MAQSHPSPPPADRPDDDLGRLFGVAGAQPLPAEGDYLAAAAWMRGLREQQVGRMPEEGLREYKKRHTRQVISDTATWMFCEHGFEQVRVADVADAAGVSEKTVYNYFPTKESLVFDREEEITARIVDALRSRDPSVSPVEALRAMMEGEQRRHGPVPAGAVWMLQAFEQLLADTPALVAARRAMTNRIVTAVAETLAEGLELDPQDPEPQIVARSLIGLWEVNETSMSRHLEDGLSGQALSDAVSDDTARAARLLETGLWAFNVFAQGKRTKRQMADAARSLDDARRQVAEAMRQARAAWLSASAAHRARHGPRR